MTSLQKVLVAVAAVGLLAAAGCKEPLDLSMQRNRIFIMGRLLAGKTCDVRLIWRKAPEDQVPARVTADLTEIGGPSEQELTASDNGTWRWAGQVTPDAAGERLITITADDAQEQKKEVSKRFRVFNTDKAIAIASQNDGLGLALKSNGTVQAWSVTDGSRIDIPDGLNNVVAISAGSHHGLALKADGTVVAWSSYPFESSDHGQADIPAGLTDVIAVSGGGNQSHALKADGKVVAWGDNRDVPAGLSDVIAVSTGFSQSMALKADGTVVVWPEVFSLEASQELYDVVAVSSQWRIHLALRADGTVVQLLYEENKVGLARLPFQVGKLKAVAIAAGLAGCAALRADGTVAEWWKSSEDGPYLDGAYYVMDGAWPNNIVAIAAGYFGHGEKTQYVLALAEDGSVTAWHDTLNARRAWPVPDELK
jgi:hypothetical protein